MGPNRTIIFPFNDFDKFTFEQMPKGQLLRFSVNPYNGNVVLTYMDGGTYADVCTRILEQLGHDLHKIRMAQEGDFSLDDYAVICEKSEFGKLPAPRVLEVNERPGRPRVKAG